MKIEILYKELYIYGDIFNVHYLEKCLPNAEFIYTSINEVPYFVNHKVNMIYMGSIPDFYQETIIKKLIEYKNNIEKLINKNVPFLITGNALDIFGKDITCDNCVTKGLNIFDFNVKRNYEKRHNSWFIGSFKDIKIIGNKSQFSFIYNNDLPFIDVITGFGNDYSNISEGILYKNFYGTKLLGPLLIMNPYFTSYFINEVLNKKVEIIYKQELIDAYNERINKLKDPKSINFIETLITRKE